MLLGILNSQASGVAIAYWLTSLGGVTDENYDAGAVDSDNNFYAVGRTNSEGAGNFDLLLAKYDELGALQWQRLLGGSSDREFGHSVAVDSSNNIYAFGYTGSEGAGNYDQLLAKYNSSGTLQWQRILGGSDQELARGVAIDSSDNIYVVGRTRSYGDASDHLLIVKYNSSGTIQWQKVLGDTGIDAEEANAIAIDSSDNIYALGRASSEGAGIYDVLLVKYNTSGVVQWQRILGKTGFDYGESVAVDSSGDIYALGYTDFGGAGDNDFLLAKYNSSGTLQWQKLLGGTDDDRGRGVAVDSSGDIYVTGETKSDGEGNRDILVAKYNSSGAVQWQRTLGGSSDERGYAVTVGASGALYVAGVTSSTGAGGSDGLIAKLPSDGSLTGSYELDGVNIVYAASSLTAASSTLTAATSTLTAATSSLTAATSTLTAATGTLTYYFVEIPA